MTRGQEIINAIEELFLVTKDCKPTYEMIGFRLGAEWADKHPKNEWISVEDSLPEQDEEVIVLCDELNVAPNYKISFGHIVDKTICQDYNGWNIPNVVYWFPMPKLPKEYEDNTTKEDIRGYCNRNCIYCDNGRCDMWDDFDMPEDVDNCDNYSENF